MSKQQGSLSQQATKRFRAGDLLLRGFDNEEIMEILEVSLSSVKRWRKKIESNGLAALARKPGSGSEAELSPEQFDELKTILAKGALAAGYQTDRWTSRIVADLIYKTWNVTYCRSHVRRILNNFKMSYQKPSVKLTKHSQEVVDHWRKHDWKRIKKSE
jgi:putative transposase